jgi:hypothetical protein
MVALPLIGFRARLAIAWFVAPTAGFCRARSTKIPETQILSYFRSTLSTVILKLLHAPLRPCYSIYLIGRRETCLGYFFCQNFARPCARVGLAQEFVVLWAHNTQDSNILLDIAQFWPFCRPMG